MDERTSPGTSSPLRILMTADTVGGVFSYALSLLRHFAAQGQQVALSTMGPRPTSDQRKELASIPGLAVFESSFALEWMDEPWAEVDAAGRWLLEVERQFRPDLVHLNGYAHASLPFAAPSLVVAHSCVLSWWKAVLGEAAPARYDYYRARVWRGLSSCDLVVAPSRAMLNAIYENYGRPEWAKVISNGVDAAELRPGPKQPYYLAAGRLWDRAKNLDLLRRVGSQLPWPLRIAGQAEESVEEANIELLGRLPRAALYQQMRGASVFLHPARYEPFGLSVLEAASSGCALVLGDLDSLREIWADDALYVKPDDAEGLLCAAENLAHDAALRERLSAGALLRAASYSSRKTANAYLQAYRELRARRRQSSSGLLNRRGRVHATVRRSQPGAPGES